MQTFEMASKNPCVVVTGATRGLGRGIAATLGQQGCAVAVVASDHAESTDVAQQLAKDIPQGRFLGVGADVRNFEQLREMVGVVTTTMGPIDIWVNNAGLALTGQPLVALDPDDFAAMVAINLCGTMNGCLAALQAMKGREGAIYNMYGAGSDGVVVPGMIGYATTKRAVQFLTQALATEVEPGRIIVGGLSPGLVLTEGFFREHAKVRVEQRSVREATVNILADDVATVATWAAKMILNNTENGREFAWLNREKIEARRAEVPSRDVLSAHRDPEGNLFTRSSHP